jgi:hypothetical protein
MERVGVITKTKCILEELFRNIPIPSGGVIHSPTSFQVSYSMEEPIQGKTLTFSKYWAENFESPPIFTDKVLAELYSPSRAKKAIFRQLGENEQNVALEIWENSTLTKVKDLKEIHGSLIATAMFGPPIWHRSENFLAYLAEPTKPKPTSFYDKDGLGD